MSAKLIICLGCAFWDTIYKVDVIPGGSAKILPEQLVQAASGMATAAAIAIGRLGGSVKLWTRIGRDATGDLFLDDLRREPIDIEGVRRLDGRTWLSTILVDRNGERLVVPFADPALDRDPSWLPLHEVAYAVAVLVDVRWVEGAEALLREARRLGVPTILDADVAPVEVLRHLMPLADHLLFSAPALEAVGGGGDTAETLARVARESGAQVAGVTLGERGAMIWDRHDPVAQPLEVPAIAAVPIDTLNAGDVWHGAYAFGLASGWALERRVRVANAAAALKCEVFGGRTGAPRLEDVLVRLAGS